MPRFVFSFNNDHYPEYIFGKYSVDEDGNRVNRWQHSNYYPKTIRINHYFTKSKEEWIERRAMGKADTTDPNDKRTIEEFYKHDNNDIFDDSALYYTAKINYLE